MKRAIICTTLAAAAGCGGTNVTDIAAGATEGEILAAVAAAEPGDIIQLGAGTFALKTTLTLATHDVTIAGAGAGKTILDFRGQAAGGDGIYAGDGADGLLIRDLSIRDTRGNGVKVIGSARVRLERLEVSWTSTDARSHGGYGLYPVDCEDVRIEGNTVRGASDSGIYVGQSRRVVIRGNTVEENVAGIEVENTHFADVFENRAERNTAGILVFALPDLPQKGCHDVRVFQNVVRANDTPSFAAEGNVLALVPAGTGILVMASSAVEVFENHVSANGTVGAGIVSYALTGLAIADPAYDPLPARVYVHHNTLDANGAAPDPTNPVGQLLLAAMPAFPGARVPAIVYDGVTLAEARNAKEICAHDNGDGGFLNLHFDRLAPDGSNAGDVLDADAAPFACRLPAVPAVVLP